MANPEKIAVLGGGVAALAAVYEITEDPNWRSKYEITVYQIGWRLGGKGASGRNLAQYGRIEEHGLHVWPGFYDNAFDLIQRCYRALGRDPAKPLATWERAFAPLNTVFVMEQIAGKWIPWRLDFQANGRLPGKSDPWVLTPLDLAQRLLKMVVDHYEASPLVAKLGPLPATAFPDSFAAKLNVPEWQGLSPPVLALRLFGSVASLSNARDAEAIHIVAWLLGNFIDALHVEEAGLAPGDHSLRRLLIALELGAVLVRGMIVDQVLTLGFDQLDDWEWTDWMRHHGASALVLDSALVRCCYDFVFGYLDGDPAKRAVVAGSGSRLLLRLILAYKEAFFFKMQAGMGDTIFAPLYLVLHARGVAFRFFHKVKKIRASTAGTTIEEIDIGRQVTLVGATAAAAVEYQPLVDVKGLPCWPSQPDFNQIVEKAQLIAGKVDLESHWTDWVDVADLTLKRGVDFDKVILGISIGAFPGICQDLIARNPRWADMVGHVKTVQTQAMQLWLDADHDQLGWHDPETVLDAFAKPFDTWADMTHLEPREDWPAANKPKSIAYFCGAFGDAPAIPPAPGTAFPVAELARVKAAAATWIAGNLTTLWPAYQSSQVIGDYHRANVNPSDRYVQSVPGSTKHRLRAGDSGFDNLYLAGDWVRNGLNGGCVEAAAMAGMAAARALTGRPIVISGESDFPTAAGRGSPYAAENSGAPWSLAYSVGQVRAASVTLVLPKAAAAAMLPDGLRLAPQPVTAPAMHPVGLMFARHRNVRPSFVPFGGFSYDELLIAVPFVEHVDPARPPGPLTHLARIYVSNLVPQALGVVLYAYDKRLARHTYQGMTYAVRQFLDGAALAHAAFNSFGDAGEIGDFPNLAIARQMLELPIVSVDPIGGFHYSFMDLHLDEASFEPIVGSVTIDSAFLAGLAVGSVAVDSIDAIPTGAFYLETRWSLTNPLQSGELAQMIRGQAA